MRPRPSEPANMPMQRNRSTIGTPIRFDARLNRTLAPIRRPAMASSRAVAKGSEVGMVTQVSAAPAGGASPGSAGFTAALPGTRLLLGGPALLCSGVCSSRVRRTRIIAAPLRPPWATSAPSVPTVPQRFHMRVSTVLQAGCFLALAGLAACGDQPATEPSAAGAPAFAQKSSDDEVTRVGHPMLTRLNAQLAAAHSNLRVEKAEIRYEGKAYDAQSATVIIANNRTHLIGSQWVPGDPRRDGRIGVTYAVDPELQTFLTGLGFPVPVIEN